MRDVFILNYKYKVWWPSKKQKWVKKHILNIFGFLTAINTKSKDALAYNDRNPQGSWSGILFEINTFNWGLVTAILLFQIFKNVCDNASCKLESPVSWI